MRFGEFVLIFFSNGLMPMKHVTLEANIYKKQSNWCSRHYQCGIIMVNSVMSLTDTRRFSVRAVHVKQGLFTHISQEGDSQMP